MMPEESWTPENANQAPLSDALEETFRAERAVFSASMRARVQAALPRPVTLAVRAARMLSAVIVLGSLGLAASCAQLAAQQTGAWEPSAVLQVTVGMGAAVIALLLSLASPRLAAWELRLFAKPENPAPTVRPVDVLFVRMGAALVLLGGVVFLY